MKTATKVFAAIFGVLAIIFYFSSILEVNTGYGSVQVANIQATVFAAACAVICAVNVVGFFILDSIENLNSSVSYAIKEGMQENSSSKKAENESSAAYTSNISNSRTTIFSERKTENGSEWKCKKCGTWNTQTALYCRDCGEYK